MACRGIRGAINVEMNDPGAIVAATREMLERIVAVNSLAVEDVVSIIFTATPDLDTAGTQRVIRSAAQIEEYSRADFAAFIAALGIGSSDQSAGNK